MHVCLLGCVHVRVRNGYTQACAQIMQHTRMHKAVTVRVEAKMLLSRRRQSDYSKNILFQANLVSNSFNLFNYTIETYTAKIPMQVPHLNYSL